MCSLLQFVNSNLKRYLIVLYRFPSLLFLLSVHKHIQSLLLEHIFTHNTYFRGPVTSNPASHSGRPPIKSQPDEQLPNRYFVLFVRLSQQNLTQYLKLHHCDCFLHMLSYSLFTKHRTIQHYKA